MNLQKNRVPILLLGLAFCGLLTIGACRGESSGKIGPAQTLDNQYAGDELSIQHGMELFNTHCASCHNFSGAEIGPSLNGVTSAVSKEWLTTYIKNPTAMIQGGDVRAAELFARYKLYMPAFPQIEGDDLEHLLGFIHKFSEAEKRNTSARSGGLINPIAEPLPDSGPVLELEEWFTAPPSAPSPPLARINKLAGFGSGKQERLFLADQRGMLYEIKSDSARPYFDLKAVEPNFIDRPGFGTGLGNFAFHPDFARNGLLYTTHTEPPGSAPADFALPDNTKAALQWVLTEWQTDAPASDSFRGSRRELLRADMVSAIHGFQEVTFNPLARPGEAEYGLLYLGIGDGGAGLGGHPELCDNPGQIWGSVVRIDPRGKTSANGQYGIPADNPFSGQAGALGEIWCRGFRNPHRITWDTGGTGFMFITNIGQHSVEEVNLGRKGADYGWPNREGTFLFDVNANSELVYPLEAPDTVYVAPALQYDHDEGNAVSGGYVYRGNQISALRGYYLFGDIPRGTIFAAPVSDMGTGKPGPVMRASLEIGGQPATLAERSLDARVDLRFAQDASGELFIFTKNDGKVYKVVGARQDCISCEAP